MSHHLKDVDRSSFQSQMLRHPFVVLPPNNPLLYTAALAGNTLNSASLPATPTMTAVRAMGGAAAININVVGATFDGTKNITFEIKGRDENWEEYTELVTCVGTGVTPQNFTTKALFSAVDRVRVLSSSNNLLVGETFSVGVGDGGATPAAGTLRIPNPIIGAPLASFSFVPHATQPAAGISPTVVSADGRQITFTTGYTTANTARMALVLPVAFTAQTLDRA